MSKMLPIHEALLLKDKAGLEFQISVRKRLIGEMVGRLYPSILQDEINKLYEKRKHLDDFIDESEMII